MIHLKDRLFFKPELSDFSVLVLHHVVVLLLLTHSCRGQVQVTGSSQPIVALLGGDITLPCHLEPVMDAADLTVEWARPDLEPRFVLLRRDGVELPIEQNSLYVGRTSLLVPKLKCGDISLKLSTVKLSDTGTYRCLVPKFSTDTVVELVVGAVSSPAIEISKVNEELVLQCESKGWYPEPEVLWLDSEGNLLSAGPTETVRGPDDLYTVSSRVTVEKRHSFTCRVQQKKINQTRETHIHVPDDFFVTSSSSSVRITISLVVCFLCVLIVVIVVWRIHKTQMHLDKSKAGKLKSTIISSSGELQLLIEGDREHLMTESEKMKHLDRTKAKLDDQLQKTEGELTHVQQIIKTLTQQKEDLKKQREKLTSLLQEVKIAIEKYKKKLKENPLLDKDKKKQKRQTNIDDLETRKKEYEELLQNTEKLMERTDKMINRMTEKKGKLENDREQIHKHLKETERQRDETQRKLQSEKSEREEETHEPKTNDAVQVCNEKTQTKQRGN